MKVGEGTVLDLTRGSRERERGNDGEGGYESGGGAGDQLAVSCSCRWIILISRMCGVWTLEAEGTYLEKAVVWGVVVGAGPREAAVGRDGQRDSGVGHADWE